MEKYRFKYEDMKFSKDGQLDELIALDRYAIPEYDNISIGDTVVAIVDDMGTKKVCEVIGIEMSNEEEDIYELKDRFGEIHNVRKSLLHKPLETEPYQLWDRWAKGAASVEKDKEYWENEFRWLMDGYKYSLGGRIQLMLGQEYVTLKKANLTAYNCFVIKTPRGKSNGLDQFLEVVDVAEIEGNIMRRGGGCGTNISHINTVKGAGRSKSFFRFILPDSHPDSDELQDRINLGKFDNVNISTEDELSDIQVGDSVEELFSSLKDMVREGFNPLREEISVNFGLLRKRDAIVKGVNGRSSGAVSWMELFVLFAELLQKEEVDNVEFAEVFSHIVHLIIQGGSRRGALMLVCNADNKNVEKFITRKTKSGYLSGANISVGISDSFMSKVKEAKYNRLANDESRKWDLIVESALKSAEPGIIFLERYNKESNSWYYNVIESTNPCNLICMAS